MLKFVKLFELTNTLADVILCAAATSIPMDPKLSSDARSASPRRRIGPSHTGLRRECCRYGPPDYLYGLFQVMSPFLDHDAGLKEILRQKAADVLLQAPSRMISCCGCNDDVREGTQGQAGEVVAEEIGPQNDAVVTTWTL